MTGDMHTSAPGCPLDEFQSTFWDSFRAAFPWLLVEGTRDDTDWVRLQVRSPERRDGEALLVLVEPARLGRPDIIVAFGGGHVHCSGFADRPAGDVTETALEAVRLIVAGKLVGISFRGGGGMLCHLSELRDRVSEGDRIQSWISGGRVEPNAPVDRPSG